MYARTNNTIWIHTQTNLLWRKPPMLLLRHSHLSVLVLRVCMPCLRKHVTNRGVTNNKIHLWGKVENTCTHTCTYIYIYIHIYTCLTGQGQRPVRFVQQGCDRGPREDECISRHLPPHRLPEEGMCPWISKSVFVLCTRDRFSWWHLPQGPQRGMPEKKVCSLCFEFECVRT